MNVAQALLARHSVRAYLDKPVDKQLIIKLLEYARQAPSGTNTQPWQVAVVSGAPKIALNGILTEAFTSGVPKDMDYNYYPPHFPKEFQVRRVACGAALYSALDIKREDREQRLSQWAKNYSAFNAPVAMFFFADKAIDKGSFMDYGMFLQSIMLMAVELGLATCPQAALAEYAGLVKKFFDYPKECLLICGMALGYEDLNHPVNQYRTDREEVTHFTRFFD